MGKKDQKKEPVKEEAQEAEKISAEAKADTPEDTPIVKELKELDDKYLALEREYEKELQKLQKEYHEKQKPFLDERKQALTAGNDSSTGTPACKGFWLQALKNHPAFEDNIEEWDEPVLEFLQDVTCTPLGLDDDKKAKSFKLEFHFCENPYFTNTVLAKEYQVEEESPYTGDLTVIEIKSSEIDWCDGKDVTVEKVAKKVKGGGAKKAKQKKEKAEPRDSVFRSFFRSLKKGDPLPDDVNPEMFGMMGDPEEMDDDEGMVEMLMENDCEMGSAVRDNIIPFAVRWYTGEADPRDSDDDEDDEEEDDDDDDEEEEDSDEEEAPKPKAKGKAKGAKKSPDSKPAADPKAEECKQQ